MEVYCMYSHDEKAVGFLHAGDRDHRGTHENSGRYIFLSFFPSI